MGVKEAAEKITELTREIDAKDARIAELETALAKVLVQSRWTLVQKIAEEALNGGAGDE